jgi:hypothetical protein
VGERDGIRIAAGQFGRRDSGVRHELVETYSQEGCDIAGDLERRRGVASAKSPHGRFTWRTIATFCGTSHKKLVKL